MGNLNDEIQIIMNELNSHMEKKIDEYPDFHVGELIRWPEKYGCFKRDEKWYIYTTDERNFCTIQGPFDLHGVIRACANKFFSTAFFGTQQLTEYRLTESERDIFIDNHFHSLVEVDEYIQSLGNES